jgi:acetolactate synthase small subunit
MAKTHLVRDDGQAAGSQQSFTSDAAVADLALGTIDATTLIANITAIQTKINALLAALRNQGIIAP